MARTRTLAYSTIISHLSTALKAGYPVDFNRREFSPLQLNLVTIYHRSVATEGTGGNPPLFFQDGASDFFRVDEKIGGGRGGVVGNLQ